ncbi:MAG: carboxylating nicotinate-nucleotide diphosphorylase [Chloroflexi bacterium]|nr:carboxylating nicotinate-nucleotide diphosphorylase [Chloroflexota bacterium]
MNTLGLPEEQLDLIVDLALAEDIGPGDITSELLVPPELHGKASLLIKAEGVLAGIEVAKRVFLQADPSLQFETLIKDGTRIKRGDIAATVAGRVIGILKAERVALNFLQKLSGIASQTAQYVAKTKGAGLNILETRKTTPGLRLLEKYAVRMGGGRNHRLNMGDLILIKDNHLAVLRALGVSLKDAVAHAKQQAPQSLKIEVEVTSPQEALDAVAGGADIIMPDNMSPEEMRHLVSLLPKHIQTEASGGITLDNIEAVAKTGVN